MLLKKSKAVIASVLSAAMAVNAMAMTMSASAAGTRTKPEAYGDSTYAERFMSLYDDVITHGIDNGYMGKSGVPYHAVEEVIVEAPDYGHVTTSEAMSYLVWASAMRDNIVTNHKDQVSTGDIASQSAGDLAKAWKTMETLIPDVQDNFWTAGSVSAQYTGEYDTPDQCPGAWGAETEKTGVNPIHSYFTSVYHGKSGTGGLYLMHWLADVDNWYGYGGSETKTVLINTFQRGEQESCWETIPHPCVDEIKFGIPGRGLKGFFNRDQQVTAQYAYTNAPDAEDRAIQGVFDADMWGVGDASVSAKAAEMGDEMRNNMYDKYYRKIGEAEGAPKSWESAAGDATTGSHYLMNWYTSWGGALQSSGQNWCWQIGCSHCHEFYQNPLAAFALITDDAMDMKAQGADADYTKSLERQIEFYLWLQSNDGPIAGGATNSYKGRYEEYPDNASTFYGMIYTPHPVYADPGSNHWIGNQVWAVQRLSELYYWVKTNGDNTGVQPGGMTLEAALERILDKWVAWFVNNTLLTEDGDFYIPSNLDWGADDFDTTQHPDTWTGTPTDNTSLHCTISGYGNTDFGCVSSLANTLIYYAAAKKVDAGDIVDYTESSVGGAFKGFDGVDAKAGTATYEKDDAKLPAVGLYLAKQLLDREWEIGRDDIGLTRTDHNGSLARMFSQPVYVPEDGTAGVSSFTGTMPNGDEIKNGATFLSIRSMYLDSSKCVGGTKTSDEAIALVKELQAAYDKDVKENGAKWSGNYSASSPEGLAELAKFTNVGAVDLQYHRFWHAGDIMMALGAMTELYPDLKPDEASEVVDPTTEPTTEVDPTTEPTTEKEEATKPDPTDVVWGDANCDGTTKLDDVVLVNKMLLNIDNTELTDQGAINSDVDVDDAVTPTDALNILCLVIDLYTVDDFPMTAQQ